LWICGWNAGEESDGVHKQRFEGVGPVHPQALKVHQVDGRQRRQDQRLQVHTLVVPPENKAIAILGLLSSEHFIQNFRRYFIAIEMEPWYLFH
jgi:hypothetical protein